MQDLAVTKSTQLLTQQPTFVFPVVWQCSPFLAWPSQTPMTAYFSHSPKHTNLNIISPITSISKQSNVSMHTISQKFDERF